MAIDTACHLNVLVPDLTEPGLETALGVLARLGYTHAVLPPIDPATAPLERWRDAFGEAGIGPITIAGQSPGADVSSEDPAERLAGRDALLAMVEATLALGGDQMNGVPYGLFGRPAGATSADAVARAAVAVGQVADRAAEHGVQVTFEVLNRYETSVMNTAEQAAAFIAASGSEHLAMHLDSFHMAVEEADLLGAVQGAVPHLGYLELGQSGRGPLATGAVDAAAVVRAALRAGYTGRIGIEAFSRSVLAPFASDLLAIWREPYGDGAALAEEAIGIVRQAEASL